MHSANFPKSWIAATFDRHFSHSANWALEGQADNVNSYLGASCEGVAAPPSPTTDTEDCGGGMNR